jgi:predicted site-specific integrase-resolvase
MYVKLEKAIKYYGVSIDTLRNWDKRAKIKTIRTKGNHRRFFIPDKQGIKYIYARVSSKKQEKNLQNQITFLQTKFPDHTVVQDIASGINFKRKGINSILEQVYDGNVQEVVVASKDRLTRFAFELYENIFKRFGTKLTVVNSEQYTSPQEELAEDLLSIVTVFTARFHGSRKYRNKKNSLLPNKRTKTLF